MMVNMVTFLAALFAPLFLALFIVAMERLESAVVNPHDKGRATSICSYFSHENFFGKALGTLAKARIKRSRRANLGTIVT